MTWPPYLSWVSRDTFVVAALTSSSAVIACHNLPRMDLIGASDPYVVLELLPASLYHKPLREYRTVTQKRTLNPDFNELFHW